MQLLCIQGSTCQKQEDCTSQVQGGSNLSYHGYKVVNCARRAKIEVCTWGKCLPGDNAFSQPTALALFRQRNFVALVYGLGEIPPFGRNDIRTLILSMRTKPAE
jgi:hypothetical protein